jgi:short-subunit dehydrogenase
MRGLRSAKRKWSDEMEIAGRLALVTGASSGIGEATARRLAAEGARVILVARSADRLAAIAAEIAARGGEASAFPCDLADDDAVVRLGEAVQRDAGVPDILINNAGAGRWLSTIETAPAEARTMIELPYLAAFAITRAFLPGMLARGSGQIVNVTSPASYMAWPNAAAYIAARQALKGFTDALRLEVERKGVTVSLVVLGPVESAYWSHNPGSRERVPKGVALLSVEEAAKTIVVAVARSRRRIVRPRVFRLMFLVEALVPGAMARG